MLLVAIDRFDGIIYPLAIAASKIIYLNNIIVSIVAKVLACITSIFRTKAPPSRKQIESKLSTQINKPRIARILRSFTISVVQSQINSCVEILPLIKTYQTFRDQLNHLQKEQTSLASKFYGPKRKKRNKQLSETYTTALERLKLTSLELKSDIDLEKADEEAIRVTAKIANLKERLQKFTSIPLSNQESPESLMLNHITIHGNKFLSALFAGLLNSFPGSLLDWTCSSKSYEFTARMKGELKFNAPKTEGDGTVSGSILRIGPVLKGKLVKAEGAIHIETGFKADCISSLLKRPISASVSKLKYIAVSHELEVTAGVTIRLGLINKTFGAAKARPFDSIVEIWSNPANVIKDPC